MKWLKVFTILLLFPFLVGCLPTYVVDDIQIVQAVGYDAIRGGKIMGTIVVPNYASGGGQNQGKQTQSSPSSVDSYSGISYMGKTQQTKLEPQSQEPLRLGKLEVVLFNEALARRGLREFIDYFTRDPEIGREMYLAVSKSRTENVLKGQYANGTAVSRYLNDMIQQNSDRNFPKNNMHQFLYNYYGEGMDPYLPLIKKVGNHIEVSGIAIFHDDHLKDEIPFEDAIIFKMMKQPFNQGTYEIKISKVEYVTVENISSNVSYKIKNGASKHPKITINIQLDGVISESPFKNTPKNNLNKLNTLMEKQLNKKADQMIQRFQEERVDPLGFGDRVRSHSRNWKEKSWNKVYPQANIKANIQVSINQTGINSG